ncbi:hypothetical protein A3860_34195 [Niastella vici]|uniref:Uncharacterized protein n=1 Tax=Niastella vici TaxID=1703345 RepID=A0A1V9FP60_9BACT|nr:hypothetical protein [Niastella vici]OQP60133.1 hypothetical protein A3860_34195 [Niastella vici]
MNKKLLLICALVMQSLFSIGQQKFVTICTSDSLTDRLIQSLFPLECTIGQTNYRVTFFEAHYTKPLTSLSGQFIMVGKPGAAEKIRPRRVLPSGNLNNVQLAAALTNGAEVSDSLFIGVIRIIWVGGILKIKADNVKLFVKGAPATFEPILSQLTKNEKLNFSFPVKNINISVDNDSAEKQITFNIKPYFRTNNLDFVLAPAKVFILNNIPNPIARFQSIVYGNNSVIILPFELLNYLSSTTFAAFKKRLSRDGFDFDLSKFRIKNQQALTQLRFDMSNPQTGTKYDAQLFSDSDGKFQECKITALTGGLIAQNFARDMQTKFNSNYANKPLFSQTDIHKEFTFKIREKDYILFLDIVDIKSSQTDMRAFNHILLVQK